MGHDLPRRPNPSIGVDALENPLGFAREENGTFGMAKIRTTSRGNGNSRLLFLACGFALGIITMWAFSCNTNESFFTELPRASSADGWHPIHVFYGEESGLDTKDQKWFAQVHQDEVIIDLIGENGYFIDLASNDAKEFSNTLALERAGWDGLCIEPNPAYWYGLRYVP